MYKHFAMLLLIFLQMPTGLCLAQMGSTKTVTGTGDPMSTVDAATDTGFGAQMSSGMSKGGRAARLPQMQRTPMPSNLGMDTQQNALQGLRNNLSSPLNSGYPQGPECMATPPAVRTDFEQFAADAAGYYLPVYGRGLFSCMASTFSPMDRVPVPPDYAIGPGDEIDLRTWGSIDLEMRLTVDRNGQISLPKVGVLNVAGLRYAQLDNFLRTAMSRIYKGFELNVTMGQLRSMQVFILGHVNQPGMYTVSSLSTLVNALFASGGPSATGTMRHIQLRRGDHVVTEFDLYDLQQKGDKSHDVQLLPGDVIFVPTVGAQIALIGNLNEPGIYELKATTSIADAVQQAGGLTSIASTDLATLERIEARSRRLVDKFQLSGDDMHRELRGGDILHIFPISPMFENAVVLRGNVLLPGRFPWHKGMRVTDVIPDRNALITREHWHLQNHTAEKGMDVHAGDRWNPRSRADQHNFNQQEIGQPGAYNQSVDSLSFYQSDPDQPSSNQPDPNQRPSTSPRHALMGSYQVDTLTDLGENDAEINWDYAAIERLDRHDLSTQLIPFNLGRALDETASAENVDLLAGDVITIFARKDLAVPMDKHALFVEVGGEVNAPGVYRVKPGDTLRDLLRQAGGITKHSYLYGLVFTRSSARELEQQQLNQSIVQMRRDLVSHFANSAQDITQSGGQGKSTVEYQLSIEQSLINQLAAVQPTGRVVLNLSRSAETVDDLPDFPLEDGDAIIVPARLGTVQVVGAVYNANAFRYEPHETVGQYLKDAGGTTRDADVSHIYLLHADGTTINNHSSNKMWLSGFDKLPLMPGDAIVVPLHLKGSGTFWQTLAPITSVLSQAAVTGLIVGNYMN